MGMILNPYVQYPPTGGFNYDDISNREFHLIAESLRGSYSDGNALTSSPGWPDETGTYVCDTIGGTPTWEDGEVNGLAVVRFVGADAERVRDLSTIAWSNKYTFVYVIKLASTATQVFFLRVNGADAYMLKRNNDDYSMLFKNDVITLATGDFTPSVAAGNWQIIIASIDFPNGSASIYINSTTPEQTPSTTGDSTLPTAAYIHVPTDTGFPDIDIAELLIYNGTAANGTECANLMSFLGAKYNISVS